MCVCGVIMNGRKDRKERLVCDRDEQVRERK